jgi:tetratricopeptide (TPR) repeat protein
MTWGMTAVAGTSLVSGLIGADAAKSAANTQAQSAANALDFQKQQFNTTQAQGAAGRAAGYNALNQLGALGSGTYQMYDAQGNPTGATPYKGYAQVANEFGITKTGKLASYCAGVCCLHLKKFDEAKKYLDKCSPNDPIVGAIHLSDLGDAYAELGNFGDAIKYYEKAANYSDNQAYTPYFLFKAGLANEHEKKNEEAKKFYEKVRDQYPNSDEGRDIEKYIARVSAQ